MGHILAVKNGVSQQFKERGSKQDEYISKFMFQTPYILIQQSKNCVLYYQFMQTREGINSSIFLVSHNCNILVIL
jgi:hypothetical protein